MARALSVLLLLTGVAAPASSADRLSFAEEQSLPTWLRDALAASAREVLPCSCLNPFYQRADFDGDGRGDYAVVVRHSTSGKRGIAFVHRRGAAVHVVGAGRPIGNGGDDLTWMDAWRVVERGPISRGAAGGPPPVLRGDGLLVEKTESASAILWWDGARYRWYQQGD